MRALDYLFAAYSIAFSAIFVYIAIQGKRLQKIKSDLRHLEELEKELDLQRN